MSVMTTTEKAGYDTHVAITNGDPHGAGYIRARLCTTVPLAAYTYANGTAGVGATITMNANGVLADIDGVTPAAGDRVLLQNGAAFSDNWLYDVTGVGSAGTAAVLTRSPLGDTQAKILAATIRVTEGNSRRGAVYEYCGNPSITMGTTALAGLRVDPQAPPNEVVTVFDDFNSTVTAPGANTTMPGPLAGFVSITGTASIAAVAGTANNRGIIRLSATTTTGSISLTWASSTRPVVFATEQYFDFEFVVFGPNALSDGTDTFRIMVGFGQNVGTGGTDGIWAEYTQATDTHWLATTRASSTSTSNASASTVTVNTAVRGRCWKYAGETTVHFSFANVEVGTGQSTNVPLGTALTLLISITKSVGNVTARTFDMDSFKFTQAWPNGRSP